MKPIIPLLVAGLFSAASYAAPAGDPSSEKDSNPTAFKDAKLVSDNAVDESIQLRPYMDDNSDRFIASEIIYYDIPDVKFIFDNKSISSFEAVIKRTVFDGWAVFRADGGECYRLLADYLEGVQIVNRSTSSCDDYASWITKR